MLDKDTMPSRAASCLCLPKKLSLSAAAFGLIGLLSAAPAQADDLLNPQALVNVTGKYSSPGALPQGAGVLDRSRPEYDALGVPLGSFLLFPTFAAGLSYDDNILRTGSGALSDTFWTFS